MLEMYQQKLRKTAENAGNIKIETQENSENAGNVTTETQETLSYFVIAISDFPDIARVFH